MRKFFVRNEADYLESDLKAMLKRMDVDSDGRVALYEFRKFLSLSTSNLIDAKTSRDLSSSFVEVNRSRSGNNFFQSKNSRFASPLRDSMRSLSPRRASPMQTNRFASPNRNTLSKSVNRYTSPLRETLNKSVHKLNQSPRSTSPRNNLSVLSRSNGFGATNMSASSYATYEEESFLNFVKDLVAEEKRTERLKTELTLKSDFNVEDLFRVFELDSRGYLTESDIKYGLNALDVYVNAAEINLLLKRFDTKNEGVLTFDGFFDMVAPYSREYRRILENRLPNSTYSLTRSDVFLQSTKYLIKELFDLLLKSETNLEATRQRLNKLSRFSTRNTFEKLDRLDKSYISESDVISY